MNTLSQILAVFVAISAILALTNYDEPIVWRPDSELRYSEPKIPDDFMDNSRKPPDDSACPKGALCYQRLKSLWLVTKVSVA